MRIVGETLLSTDVSAAADEIGPALHEVLTQTIDRITQPFLPPDWLPTPANLRFKKARATLDRIVLGVVADRRRTGEDPGDLLSMLMHAKDEDSGEAMTDQQLRDEAMTIFIAGHETTANALAWTLHLLAQHPEAEAKLRAELAVLQGLSPTATDLPRLPYLAQVVKESMRLYPPVWVLARAAAEANVIGGYEIPNGSRVFLSPYTLHRHPNFWPEPEAFLPERWANPDVPAHKAAYLPFSTGGRKCIGDHFAMMEAELVLAVILQRATLRSLPGFVVAMEPTVTLRPLGGLLMVPGVAPQVVGQVAGSEPTVAGGAERCPFGHG